MAVSFNVVRNYQSVTERLVWCANLSTRRLALIVALPLSLTSNAEKEERERGKRKRKEKEERERGKRKRKEKRKEKDEYCKKTMVFSRTSVLQFMNNIIYLL